MPDPGRAVIVIFGAAIRPNGQPSGVLRDRVSAALRFGQTLLPPPLYLPTGGQGRFGPPEADVMAELLQNSGVAEDDIMPERTGRNTLRSAVAVAWMLHGRNAPVFVATSAYHMPRCVALLTVAGLRARRGPIASGPAASRLLRRWFWRLREGPAIPVDCIILLFNRRKLMRAAERSRG